MAVIVLQTNTETLRTPLDQALINDREGSKRNAVREWYSLHFCDEKHVQKIAAFQNHRFFNNRFAVYYFRMWSFLADVIFFTSAIPPLLWAGLPLEALRVVCLLNMVQYFGSVAKDWCGCERPPCPPLKLWGKEDLHKVEYGFPSTHAAHSGVFSYFVFTLLLRYSAPTHKLLYCCIALFYTIMIGISRVFLAMHWPMDVVGGWIMAVFVIVVHEGFLSRLETYAATHTSLLVIIVTVSVGLGGLVVHPSAIEKCPCIKDTLRFVGSMLGLYFSFWLMKACYGVVTPIEATPLIQDTMMRWSFLKLAVPGVVVAMLLKELTEAGSKPLFRFLWMAAAGCYLDRIPSPFRSVALHICRLLGRVLRRPARPSRLGVSSLNSEKTKEEASSAFENVSDKVVKCSIDSPCLGIVSQASTSSTNYTRSMDTLVQSTSVASNPSTCVIEFKQEKGKRHGEASAPGFLSNSSQQWSLFVFQHWWVWELYSKVLAYIILAMWCGFAYPIILKTWFLNQRSS